MHDAGGWSTPLNERLGVASVMRARSTGRSIAERGVGRDQLGREVALRAVPRRARHAAAGARESTRRSRRGAAGGNIDCAELVAGTTLFLPIPVDGALFSAGDGHGRQGDGEVSQLAIECPVERAELTLSRPRRPRSSTTPVAPTADAWLTFGFDEDLDEAAAIAIEAMLDADGPRAWARAA